RVIDQMLQVAARARVRHQPLEVQRHRHIVPSVIFLANQVVRGNPDVFEEYLVAALAAHCREWPNSHSWKLDRNYEDGKSAMFGYLGVGARQQPDVSRVMGG